ncbi:MAG TPA: choice-of-anchor A family protein, partial [Melioribacteraceae bacterium]|nr:choice-of-anchor A family protein [Melioribacteraceae bacterium]
MEVDKRKAMDIIDNGFNIQNVVVSQGTFYDGTSSKGSKTIMPPGGTWDVGNLENGASATLQISVKVSSEELLATRLDFREAADFNVFVFQDINQPSSDTEGKMAAGRDAFLANYSVGDKLPNSNGNEDVLVVGRNLTFLTGAVFGGNVVYGYQTNLPVDYVSVEGEVKKDTVINFAAAKSYFIDLSSTISNYQVNGKDTLIWSSLHLTGVHPVVNIFKVDKESFNNSNEIYINVPIGSTALINIEGDSLVFDGGLVLNGTDKFTTLFNFFEARKLNIVGIDIQGTVLAPKSDVNYYSGQLNGQFIANSVVGQGQFNLAKFIGNVPATSTLQNIAELLWADQIDVDSEPGNGVASEDDYASVSINVNPNLVVGSGTNNANWQYAGSLNNDEIIWTFNRDANGNLLSGTWGGKIYRSLDEGASWEQANIGMNVGYIWSLLPFDNGVIYAATEKGVYASDNLGANWNPVALIGKDTRSLVFGNNRIYAAVWGEGVFEST